MLVIKKWKIDLAFLWFLYSEYKNGKDISQICFFFLLRQLCIVNCYIQCSSNNLWNENINTGVYRETQVRSPAVRLRLARCMAWVKRWSEAMDFLLTIFKTNIFLLRILENRNSRKLSQSIYGGSRQKWGKKTEIHAN